jgi:acetoin utilization protein AcuB
MKTVPITAYMTHYPLSIGSDQTAATARALMKKHAIRHLPVLDGGHIVGLLSERDLDLVETLKDVDPAKVAVEEAMSQNPYVVPPTKSLGEVVREMARHKYGAAVVAEGPKVVGVFTTIDALNALGSTVIWDEQHPW